LADVSQVKEDQIEYIACWSESDWCSSVRLEKIVLSSLGPAKMETKEPVFLSGKASFVAPITCGRSLQMRIVNPVRDPTWDDLVTLHRDASCFHTSAWAKVLHQSYGHQPFYLQFWHGRTLAALVPLMQVRSLFTGRRGVCLPFSDACEPLIFNPEWSGVVSGELIRFARERHWRYLELRGKSVRLAANPVGQFYGHRLDLRRGTEALITSFASSVRRAIRKAERSGVNALIVRNRQAIDDFYQLHVQTRRRHGLPPQPVSFFLSIYEHIIKPGLGFIVLARYASRSIAAAIFFRFGKNALFKYGASDKRFQEFRANNLVMWQGIQVLAQAGAEKLHFGRTDCANEGLRRFKLSWNTEEETLDYFRADPSGRECLAHVRSNSAFHKQIFGKLPLVFNQVAGSMIYPHLD
jgi:Acetyltransferase (GNAT) domain